MRQYTFEAMNESYGAPMLIKFVRYNAVHSQS